MVKKRSKNKEVAAGMDIDKPATGEWQTGVSAMTEASEPSNLPTIGEKQYSLVNKRNHPAS